MRIHVGILILSIPFILNGQESAEPVLRVESGNWWTYVGAYLAPEFAFRTLENNDGSQISEETIESRNDREIVKFGYTNGLIIESIYRKNFGFETGISYSNQGYQTKRQEIVFGDINDSKRGFNSSVDGSASYAKFINHFEYVGVPIALKYLSGDWLQKWRFSVKIGCSANYLIRARSTLVLYYDDDRPKRSSQEFETDYEQFNLTPFIGLGVDHQLSPKMRLSASPTVRYGTLDIIDAPITEKLFSMGVQFGWYLRL